jgi:hypothetical protein
MISEMDVMLLNGTLKIVCPVCDVFLRMPLPGEKTLPKLRGYTTLPLDFWEMFQDMNNETTPLNFKILFTIILPQHRHIHCWHPKSARQ